MMTTYTAEQIEAIGGNRWTKGDGTLRVYLNDWGRLIGLDVGRYKTGNISSATIHGERISNSKAGRILAAKVYWENGEIIITPGVAAEEYATELLAGIAAAVAEQQVT